MTTTITIKDKAVNTTYQNVTGLTGGSGVDAVFDVTKTNGTYSVVLDSLAASAGTGYVAGDTITLAGTALGGTVSNNLIVTVATVGAAGKIATFGVVGTGRVGDGTVDVAVDVTGTAGIDTYTFWWRQHRVHSGQSRRQNHSGQHIGYQCFIHSG